MNSDRAADPDDGVRVSWLGRPRDGDRTVPTLVALHGYGANEQLLMAAVPMLGMLLPGIVARVIAPRGGFPVPGRPHGWSWFPGSVDRQPPAEAIAAVADETAAAVARYTDRAVWLGFSQGMCTAITVLRRSPGMFDGLVALSGFTFDQAQPGDAILRSRLAAGDGVPAFYGRDPADPRIPGFASSYALEFLRDHTRLTERSYPGIRHGVGPAEIADVVAFLRPLLGG